MERKPACRPLLSRSKSCSRGQKSFFPGRDLRSLSPKMIASDRTGTTFVQCTEKITRRCNGWKRERERGRREKRPLSSSSSLPLSTLIASSRSTDQTDRELKRSLALLRLALWPRRNTGTLERAAWLEPLARVSIETRFFSIYCPLLAGFFESIVRMYIYICIRYAPRKWMFVGWWRLRVGKIFFSRKRNNPYFEIRCTLGDRPISYAVSKIFSSILFSTNHVLSEIIISVCDREGKFSKLRSLFWSKFSETRRNSSNATIAASVS